MQNQPFILDLLVNPNEQEDEDQEINVTDDAEGVSSSVQNKPFTKGNNTTETARNLTPETTQTKKISESGKYEFQY